MAETIVNIDVIDMSIPIGNNRNIAIINQPNPCYNYPANADEVKKLMQLPYYYIYAAGTHDIINPWNFYDYFPNEGGGGGSGGGGVTVEEVEAMIANAIDSSVSTTSTNAVQNAAITNFVNSSIESSTGQFRGTFESKAEMDLVEGSKNDYAFLVVRNPDDTVNHYERYKWVIDTAEEPPVGSWEYEYDLNNSSFTAEQWAAINSGVKSSDITQIGTNQANIAKLQADIAKVGTTFRGVFNTQQAIDSTAADKNDTAILQSTDANGNTIYTMESYVSIEPSGDIPSDYTQLLYIQSSGAQYINTGVVPSSTRRIYIKFNPLDYMYNVSFFGLTGFSDRGYADNFQLRTDAGNGAFFLNGTSFTAQFEFPGINEFEYHYPSMTINGNVSSISDTGEWGYGEGSNIYLFAFRSQMGGTPMADGFASMRLYGCKIYDTDGVTLVRDFVPVRNSSNEIGLYDVINGEFYGNSGSGSFTAGPAADGYWIVNYSFLASIQGSLDSINEIIEGVL